MPKEWNTELSVDVGLDARDDTEALREIAARRLKVSPDELPRVELLRRSIDARAGRIRLHLLIGVTSTTPRPLAEPPLRECAKPARVVIVGDGPGGLFCAYELARAGIASVILDRGKPVQPRRHDLKALHRHGRVDPDSNYCFGEGGAGTYSDGKLYTRSHKRGNVRDVLEVLVAHGAPAEILVDARPHVGSNRLPAVVSELRRDLESVGVEFRFGARVTELLVERGGGERRVGGVRLHDGRELSCEHVVLATGHSARDIFHMLERIGVELEPKAFAMGVRVEHSQSLVDRVQYRSQAGHPRLPPAAYRLAEEIDGRGVFSFCMCPGGFVVPASTDPGELVVNGMSLARRAGKFANAGIVVAVEPADLEAAGYSGPLGGILAQQRIERAAFLAGGGGLRAPACRVDDFVSLKVSSSLPETSYLPGLAPADLEQVLEAGGVKICERLRRGLAAFNRHMRGFVTGEAALIGVETRTSSPVRVIRDVNTLEAPALRNLYPCGEGAGHAGGIVSAAVDGLRIAHVIAARLT